MRTVGRVEPSLVEALMEEEPPWMRKIRTMSFELFNRMNDPLWLQGIDTLDLSVLRVEREPSEKEMEQVINFYKRAGLENYIDYLSGLGVTVNSNTLIEKAMEMLRKEGVIFTTMEDAVRNYSHLVRRYFGKIFPPGEHRYAALHYALWKGGIFLYVPDGVEIKFPIEAFFAFSRELFAQFEHTLIVVGEGASVNFVESCASPRFSRYDFHDGVVEIYVHKDGEIKFTTVQNWSTSVINFNSKRAYLEEGAKIFWTEGSFGSRYSYVYPSVILREGARAEFRLFSVAKDGQWKEGGAKIFLMGKAKANIISRSVASEGSTVVFRGLVRALPPSRGSRVALSCDTLLLDRGAKGMTYPHFQLETEILLSHEASTSFLSDDQLFYLASRGIPEEKARALIVTGFLADILKDLPPTYAEVFKRVLSYNFSEGVG